MRIYPIEIGNLRKENFSDIWENSATLKTLRRRDNLVDNCGKCEFRMYAAVVEPVPIPIPGTLTAVIWGASGTA